MTEPLTDAVEDRRIAQPSADATETAEINALSLEQALRDFEVANGRVVDLTQRLIDVTEERRALVTELESVRLDAARAHAELAAERAGRGYRVLRLIRAGSRLARGL